MVRWSLIFHILQYQRCYWCLWGRLHFFPLYGIRQHINILFHTFLVSIHGLNVFQIFLEAFWTWRSSATVRNTPVILWNFCHSTPGAMGRIISSYAGTVCFVFRIKFCIVENQLHADRMKWTEILKKIVCFGKFLLIFNFPWTNFFCKKNGLMNINIFFDRNNILLPLKEMLN